MAPLGVEAWIVISTCLVAGGWILSALGQLNMGGYAVVRVMAAVLCWRMIHPGANRPVRYRLKRFRRPLPILFLILAACGLIGGLLYAPTNWDALAYRVPRVLNWLDAQKWHWIHTNGPRLNSRAAGFEWLMTPLILFTKSDRPIFLINFVSFLLLPGLIFSVFARIGVRPRVAWYWMWLLPGGYVFALQAGSIGNDSFAAVYALAAVDYALRGTVSKRFKDFALSLLAAGLLTGAKATNLPLLLPWFIVVLPLIARWLRQKPALSLAAATLALLISFLPTAVLNQLYSGDWTGVNVERTAEPYITVQNPIVGIGTHSLLLLLQNMVPPFFLLAQWFNQHLTDFLPTSLLNTLSTNFHGMGIFKLWELPGEDGFCGIGFGATILLLAALSVALRSGFRLGSTKSMTVQRQLAFCIAPFLAAAVVMARSGFACNRLVAPYYPFLFASLLVFVGHRRVITARWWHWTSVAMMLLSVLVVAVTPARPLFPVGTVLQAAANRWSGSALLARAQRVYSVYAERADALREIRNTLPADIDIIGFASSNDDPEVSLWRPFSTRHVIHVLPADNADNLRQKRIQYVVLNSHALQLTHQMTLENWCRKYHGQLLRQWIFPRRAADENEGWYLVRISDVPSATGLTRADILDNMQPRGN